MTSSPWLIEEIEPLDEIDMADIDRAGGLDSDLRTRGRTHAPPLAITLHDVVIHDVRKWFGSADIRIDALVVHGPAPEHGHSVYQPRTFRFSGVRDGEKLTIDTGGLLIFYGVPVHFVDIYIVVSRDRRDSDTLDSLITGVAQSGALTQAAQTIGALALPGPAGALISPALVAAATLGDMVYQLVKDVSGNSLGLYRGSWLQIRDAFGVGRHPEDHETFDIKDISFRYEIAVEDAKRR